MNFESRLAFLIKDRKKTPWGKALGFTSPSITAIFSGHVPGPEFLQAISRSENVNLNWLLTGKGQPYITNFFSDAESFENNIDTMLSDEKWTVYVCSLSERTILVLTQPGQYEFKGKRINYTLCEIMIGPGSEELAKTLRQHLRFRDIYTAYDFPDEALYQMEIGEIGTYALLNHPGSDFVKDAKPATEATLQFIEENKQTAPVSVPLMRAVIQLVFDCKERINIKLTTAEQARVITAVYRQAERLNLSEEEISSAVEAALEVLTD